MQRIVIKLGTSVVSHPSGGLNEAQLLAVAEFTKQRIDSGDHVILVSSGAVGLGRQKLGLFPPLSVAEKQACASVGQSLLIERYSRLFEPLGLFVGQVLVASEDLSRRITYTNLANTFNELVKRRVVPILNENDAISSEELSTYREARTKSFGDNDKLSALIAAKLEADLLMIFTDVDGVYTDNPFKNPEARRLNHVTELSQLDEVKLQGSSNSGRGGMHGKLLAARTASLCGVKTVIAKGTDVDAMKALFQDIGQGIQSAYGTWVDATQKPSAKKAWLRFAGAHGRVVVNAGAVKALQNHGASLLATGVVDVEGDFLKGDLVSVVDESGEEIARGQAEFSSDRLRHLMGKGKESLQGLLNSEEKDEAIHRSHMALIVKGQDD